MDKKASEILKKFIKEEIGRSYHTKDNMSYTFDDYADYDIEINSNQSGDFFLNVFYSGKKIAPTGRYASHEEAFHASRMIIEKDKIKRMNS